MDTKKNTKIINFNTVNFQLPKDVQEEGGIKNIEAYKISKSKQIFSYILFILSFGILYLYTRW
jgi:cation-transporting ATPase 13A2